MARHSFVQIGKLKNVKGRINYISSPERQENLYAVVSTANMKFWRDLSKECQQEFKRSGANGSCIEARELIIALPKSFYEQYDPQQVLAVFTDSFKKTHGVECISALHHNKRKTNYHIHLIFSERKLLDEPVKKIASRNMFYNEQGKHVRTKKEILDEQGELRPGCLIVPKGQVYEQRLFTNKEIYFKGEEFLENEKKRYTDLINQYIRNSDEKLQVFKKDSAYLPTKKVGKNNPRASKIQADNEVRGMWNQTVDVALVEGVPEKEIRIVKKEQISQRAWKSIREYGRKPGIFRIIVTMAINALKLIIEKVKLPPKPKLTVDIQEFREMQHIYEELIHQVNEIKVLENQELPELERKLQKLGGFFKGKERRIIENRIDETKSRVESRKAYMPQIVSRYGYKTIEDFINVYRKSEELILQYQQDMERWEERVEILSSKRESVREQLQQYRNDKTGVRSCTTSSRGRGRGAR